MRQRHRRVRSLCSKPPGRHAQPEVHCNQPAKYHPNVYPDQALYRRVIIAPTRGSNAALRSRSASASGHHRPYEGQQRYLQCSRQCERKQVIIAPTRGSNRIVVAATGQSNSVIIAPTRGSNLTATPIDPSQAGHHRPYEGQQQLRRSFIAVEPTGVIIAPTRGSNASTWNTPPGHSQPGHHRPYEGQQPELEAGEVGVGGGSSSPLRGAATRRRP